jgi:hypothetical protein
MRPLALVVREYRRSLARSPALSISSVFSSPMVGILVAARGRRNGLEAGRRLHKLT